MFAVTPERSRAAAASEPTRTSSVAISSSDLSGMACRKAGRTRPAVLPGTGPGAFDSRDARVLPGQGERLVAVRKARARALPLDLALALDPRALLDAIPVEEHPLHSGDGLRRMSGDG